MPNGIMGTSIFSCNCKGAKHYTGCLKKTGGKNFRFDFDILFRPVDLTKYNAFKMPVTDIWGVLMRKDSPLASKETIGPEYLWEKPLILSLHPPATSIPCDSV